MLLHLGQNVITVHNEMYQSLLNFFTKNAALIWGRRLKLLVPYLGA